MGGSTDETYSSSIAIDSAGHAYVAGSTSETDFPVTAGAFQTSKKGIQDCFVTKLSPNGASLVYSTYLGGSENDNAYSIRVDTNGSAYVSGRAGSDFPITPGVFQESLAGDEDGFISKFSADGTALIYSTYLGGSIALNRAVSFISAITIDAAGNVYATGPTSASNFPVTPGAFQTTLKGDSSTFVTKISSDFSSLVYSTYVGGSGYDNFSIGICIDEQGNAYVTGYTKSPDFPVTPGAAQGSYGGNGDAYVFKLSADGSALAYSTYLGGSSDDTGCAITLASGNRACVSGYTYSSNFPTTPWVRPTALHGDRAAFLAIISEDGTFFIASNYIGGDNESKASGITLGTDGSVYITGSTNSTNFPVTPGAFQTTNHGDFDAFVYRTKFAMYAKSSVTITKL